MKQTEVAQPSEAPRLEDPRVLAAVEEYLAAQQAGRAPRRQEFMARHPEVAAALADCLDGLELIQAAAPRLHGSAPDGADSAVTPDVYPEGPLGDYRIVREVGRGGMGVVYEAEQISLGRRVALKVLPFAATLDPRQLQRFHNEARAAAGLHHTNIVPVHAVGCERGVHYYAMQFIDGRTLADFIAQQRREAVAGVLTTDEAAAAEATTQSVKAQATSTAPRDAGYYRLVAEWGIQAAQALDCAHTLGVLHRDVKPANLLVDATGRLWVTDFGLAQVQSDARLTQTGDLVGTLRYMSPEQALAQRGGVDHRTDVYSLGATLYELLTLEPAFPGNDRQELLRQIAFEEPRRPRLLNKAIPAELETIVLKAMEKNPAERYATAQDLADDLERFLKDEPIRARRPTWLQRGRKWAQRHRPVVRTAVAAVALLLLVGLIGLGVSTALIWQAKQQTESQKERAETEKELALGNFQLAMQALDRIYLRVAEEGLPRDPKRKQEYQKLLRDGLEFYEAFARRNHANPQARREVARAHARLGEIRQLLGQHADAENAFRQALALLVQPDEPSDEAGHRNLLAMVYRSLGNLLKVVGRLGEAETAYGQALGLWDTLAGEFPKNLDYRISRTDCHEWQGSLYWRTGRLERAEQAFRQGLSLWAGLVAEFPSSTHYRAKLAGSHGNLAVVLTETDRAGEADKVFVQALRLYREVLARSARPSYRKDLAVFLFSRGKLLQDIHRPREAEQSYRQAIDLTAELIRDFPSVPDYKMDQVGNYCMWADMLFERGQFQKAEQAYRDGLDLGEKVVALHAVPEYQHVLSVAYHNLACMLEARGRFAEAEKAYGQTLDLRKKLTIQFPTVPEYRNTLARAHENLGNLLAATPGRARDAEAAYRQGLSVAALLVEDFPNASMYQQEVAQCLTRLGHFLRKTGRLPEAEQSYGKARSFLQELVDRYPGTPLYRRNLAGCYLSLANLLIQAGRLPEAEAASRQSMVRIRALAREFPDVADYQANHALAYHNRADLLRVQGRPRDAEKALRQGIRLREELMIQYPENPTGRKELLYVLYALAAFFHSSGRDNDALSMYEEMIQKYPGVPANRQGLADHLGLIAASMMFKGQLKGSEKVVRRAVALREALAREFPREPSYRRDWAVDIGKLCTILVETARSQEAEKAQRQALALLHTLTREFPEDPVYPRYCAHVLSNWSLVLKRTGRVPEAEKALRQAIALQKDLVARFAAAPTRSVTSGPQIVHGMAVYQVTPTPDYREELARCHGYLGLLLSETGHLEEVAKVWREGVKILPENAELNNSLAWFLANCSDVKLRDPAEAVGLARKAVRQAPQQAGFRNTLGVALYRAGDWKGAVEALKKSIELSKTGSSFDFFFLAMAQERLGNPDEARRKYRRAVRAMANKPPSEELRRCQAEAAALLGVKEKKD